MNFILRALDSICTGIKHDNRKQIRSESDGSPSVLKVAEETAVCHRATSKYVI